MTYNVSCQTLNPTIRIHDEMLAHIAIYQVSFLTSIETHFYIVIDATNSVT